MEDQSEAAGIRQDTAFGEALSHLIDASIEYAAAGSRASVEEEKSPEHTSKKQAVSCGWDAVYAVADAYCARYHAQQIEQAKHLKGAERLKGGGEMTE